MRHIYSLLVALVLVLGITAAAPAQTFDGPDLPVANSGRAVPDGNGNWLLNLSAPGAAAGHDMWTSAMLKKNLFEPHINDCDPATEVFKSMLEEGGTLYGYCIDKDRSGPHTWNNARSVCLSAGKRLPEPLELIKVVQAKPGDLLNIPDDGTFEWASNFPVHTPNDGTSNTIMTTVVSFDEVTLSAIIRDNDIEPKLYTRCVR